jgi:phenylpropionate dioxygenase-like ring-hydroxylating dioxygenase large terminal subunit
MDTGTAYGRTAPAFDAELVQVGPGTPGGEMLRRYWHPIAVAADIGRRPMKVRVLGEDLVLFRDLRGRPGLLYPRCAHRGTTLYYGRVEDDGIRCCYHGWLFDVEGHCLDQPCEPRDHVASPAYRARYRQPWYPVAEYLGLVFAYLGPPDRKPVLPRWDVFEAVPEGEEIVADGGNIGLEGETTPCNWVQTHENVMDPYHVFVLHSSHSGTQFVPLMGILPEVSWYETPLGVKSHQDRRRPDGATFHRVTEVVMPNVRIVANPRVRRYGPSDSVAWTLPIDDTTTRIFTLYRTPRGQRHERMRFDGRRWAELTEEEHQRMPNDYEAQVGQGAITLHSEEHLTGTDRGVVMFRRRLRQQIAAVREGRDPLGVTFDPARAIVHVEAGNFLRQAAGGAVAPY